MIVMLVIKVWVIAMLVMMVLVVVMLAMKVLVNVMLHLMALLNAMLVLMALAILTLVMWFCWLHNGSDITCECKAGDVEFNGVDTGINSSGAGINGESMGRYWNRWCRCCPGINRAGA